MIQGQACSREENEEVRLGYVHVSKNSKFFEGEEADHLRKLYDSAPMQFWPVECEP